MISFLQYESINHCLLTIVLVTIWGDLQFTRHLATLRRPVEPAVPAGIQPANPPAILQRRSHNRGRHWDRKRRD